jgi:hypothetical protein
MHIQGGGDGGVVEVATVEGRVELNIPEQRLLQSVTLTGLKVRIEMDMIGITLFVSFWRR